MSKNNFILFTALIYTLPIVGCGSASSFSLKPTTLPTSQNKPEISLGTPTTPRPQSTPQPTVNPTTPATTAPSIQTTCLTGNTPAPLADAASLSVENEILSATNAYRTSKGLKSLSLNAVMSAIARGHSKNMAKGVYGFGHDFFSDRVQVIACHGIGGWGAAENAAMGGGA